MSLMWKQFHLCFYKIKCSASNLSAAASSSPDYSTSQCGDDLFSSTAAGEESLDSSEAHPPDLASAYASRRFFFSSPGRSNSIMDSPESRSVIAVAPGTVGAAGGVTVPKYSFDPYEDFRRSMQEMMAAREQFLEEEDHFDWDYLQELLLCYLALNPTQTHKQIIQAFTDIIISLLSSPSSSSSSSSSPALRFCQNPRDAEDLHRVSRRLVFD